MSVRTLRLCAAGIGILWMSFALAQSDRMPIPEAVGHASVTAAAPLPPLCQAAIKGQLPLSHMRDGRFVTSIRIDDAPALMLIDTGAGHTAISSGFAQAMGMRVDSSRSVRITGIGGSIEATHPVVVPTMVFGPLTLKDYDVNVAHITLPGQEADPTMPVGLIGADLLARFDVELDFPNHVMTLYDVSTCIGRRFMPWTGRYQAFQIPPAAQHKVIVPVRLNDHMMRALVDTGSNRTNVSLAAALAAGVSAATLNQEAAHPEGGAAGAMVDAHRHRFDNMTIGSATFRNAPLLVEDGDFQSVDMLLGIDFLQWRKLWISYATNQLFIQHTPKTHESAQGQR